MELWVWAINAGQHMWWTFRLEFTSTYLWSGQPCDNPQWYYRKLF